LLILAVRGGQDMKSCEQWRSQSQQHEKTENQRAGRSEAVGNQRPKACFDEAKVRRHTDNISSRQGASWCF
jgi:hypothetical protein